MRLPRFLWVPFELGRPFGAPHEPDFQRRVLHEALSLVERTDGPIVLADFPDDAPTADEDDVAWSCPISFARPTAEEPELVAAARAEIAQLSPWAELAPPPAPNSGLAPGGMIDRVAATIDDPGTIDVEMIRLTADDLRAWCLHAVAQQPGRATSHDRNTWFWRDTASAHLLGRLAAALIDDPDPRVRMFADRAIVPRDHWDHLVAEPAANPMSNTPVPEETDD